MIYPMLTSRKFPDHKGVLAFMGQTCRWKLIQSRSAGSPPTWHLLTKLKILGRISWILHGSWTVMETGKQWCNILFVL